MRGFPEREAIPGLSPLPRRGGRRLIDQGFLHRDASAAGLSERYRRGETSHTVHVWWARRPHSAMRPLVFATLCPEVSAETLRLLYALSSTGRVPEAVLAAASGQLGKSYGKPPRLLDMFGGGGTIAFEAATLGAEAHSIDSNQLAVFVQKCNLEYAARSDPSLLPGLVKESGWRVLRRLTGRTNPLFPLRGKLFGYYWTYSRACDGCGGPFFLSRRPWLSRKGGKKIFIESSFSGAGGRVLRIRRGGESQGPETAWAGRRGRAVCPRCGRAGAGISIKSCRDELVAVARLAEGGGKEFFRAGPEALPPAGVIGKMERRVLRELGETIPDSRLPGWSGIVNPALYGMESHGDILNPRQRVVLLLLIQCLREEHRRLKKAASLDTARCVTGFLSGLIDQLVDWNCRLSMWIPQNEQVGRAFCGPGVAMLWDYMETDPLLGGPANLWKKLDRIVAGASAVAANRNPVHVRHGYAQELPFRAGTFDAIVTDPPYYDNLYYNVLADFFYPWKRQLLKEIEPDLFRNPSTDGSRELVASRFRCGSPERAHEQYCEELARALKEAERVLKPGGVLSLLYSHSSLKGWEALVRGFRATGLRVTSVQPLGIERRQRPRAVSSDAVNTCVVFVAHRSRSRRRKASAGRLAQNLRSLGEDLAAVLRAAGWQEKDLGLACYSQGVGLLGNVESLMGGTTDLEALKSFEGVVRETVPSFQVAGRNSL